MPRDSQRSRVYAADAVSGKRYKTVTEVKAFVDEVMGSRWVRARWGVRDVQVKDGRGRRVAYGNRWEICVPLWARTQGTILHELAHGLTPNRYAPHGPEYAGVLLELVRHVFGPEGGKAQIAAFRKHRVKWNRKAIPEPKHEVPTKASEQARVRAARSRPLTRGEAHEAAEAIRRAVKAGKFGPAGRKPRVHALETARVLEAL